MQPHCNKLPNERDVEIDCTNWRGERCKRKVRPIRLDFSTNEWHKERQWLLTAWCLETNSVKTFALLGIHEWKAATVEPQMDEVTRKLLQELSDRNAKQAGGER